MVFMVTQCVLHNTTKKGKQVFNLFGFDEIVNGSVLLLGRFLLHQYHQLLKKHYQLFKGHNQLIKE